jgi:aminoglycoside 3-N-acetyltransferase
MTSRQEILAAIRALGVRGGDWMIVHSSFKSFGPAEAVNGGPGTVAQALVDAVSPGGSVFVPTFNYGKDPYDPAVAPSYDGIITEFFHKLPGAVRSLHPTHPIAGIGPDAASVLRDHDKAHAFGIGSPCWKLWEHDGWVLLLGVNHNANSVAHVAEELLAMPYLDRKRSARVVQPDGTIREVVIRRPGCSDAWDAVLDPPLRAMGAIREGRVGNARLMLMRARAVVEATCGLLQRDPTALLCTACGCDACEIARRMLKMIRKDRKEDEQK